MHFSRTGETCESVSHVLMKAQVQGEEVVLGPNTLWKVWSPEAIVKYVNSMILDWSYSVCLYSRF